MVSDQPKYPDVKVHAAASGIALLHRVKNALKAAEVPAAEVDAFYKEALEGDYSNLLHVCTKWVTVVQE